MESQAQSEPVHALAFDDAVREGVHVPLAAMRATLETLVATSATESPNRLLVQGVLEELGRLQRNVQGLVDLCLPPRHHPNPCRVEEVVSSALGELCGAKRQRVVVAIDERLPKLEVDGARLARTLRLLLDCSLDCPFSETLLSCRATDSGLSLGVVCEVGSPMRGDSRIHELQLALADRELRRMGATLDTTAREGLFIRFETSDRRNVA